MMLWIVHGATNGPHDVHAPPSLYPLKSHCSSKNMVPLSAAEVCGAIRDQCRPATSLRDDRAVLTLTAAAVCTSASSCSLRVMGGDPEAVAGSPDMEEAAVETPFVRPADIAAHLPTNMDKGRSEVTHPSSHGCGGA